jgi:hypothetical protein
LPPGALQALGGDCNLPDKALDESDYRLRDQDLTVEGNNKVAVRRTSLKWDIRTPQGATMTNQEPLLFAKSAYSQQGNCVSWAVASEFVYLRDTKAPGGPSLRMDYDAWRDFTQAVANGQPSTATVVYAKDALGVSVWHRADPVVALRFSLSEWMAFTLATRSGEVYQAQAS